MARRINTYPEWVEKYRKKGVTIRKKGNGYGLYKCSSVYVKGGKYPKAVQEFLGMVYEDRGFVKKTVRSEKPIYLEHGLSSFIMKNFYRELEKSTYDRNEKIVKLGIIYFIFHSYDKVFLSGSTLTLNDEELIGYSERISEKRILTVSRRINTLLKEKIVDENDRSKLIGLLRLCVKDSLSLKEPVIHPEITRIIERYNLSLWQ